MAIRRELPLATVLTWSDTLLMEEAARVLVDTAQLEAQRLKADEQAPPSGDGLLDRATRAFYGQLVAEERARKVKENDDAFAELVAAGAFG